jgi:hypothetical protein
MSSRPSSHLITKRSSQPAIQPKTAGKKLGRGQSEKAARNSPLDNPTSAELERQRSATPIAGVELRARVLQCAGVVHVDGVALNRLALACHRRGQVLDFQPRRCTEAGECEGRGEEGAEKSHFGF